MAEFLKSTLFGSYVLPLIFVILGVVVNLLGRRDNSRHIFRNDLAVGSTVCLLSISTVFSDVHYASSDQLAEFLGWLLLMIAVLLGSLLNDRFGSWDRDGNGDPLEVKRWFFGIILPIAVSCALFIIYKYNIN